MSDGDKLKKIEDDIANLRRLVEKIIAQSNHHFNDLSQRIEHLESLLGQRDAPPPNSD